MKTAFTTRALFIALFTVAAFIGMRINFSPLVGTENQFFTLFQFFGPVTGSFLGSSVGALAVVVAQLADLLITGKELTFLNVARLMPMVCAAAYFGMRGRIDQRSLFSVIIPLAAIAAFVIHPVGRQVWFFAAYWLIPVVVKLLPERFAQNIFLHSLGSTFTAHAVGGAVWVWGVPGMTAANWIALIPVVAYERLLFTGGIVISYYAFRSVLQWVMKRMRVVVSPKVLRLDPELTVW